MRQLICLIGPSGSGKSTAGKILEQKGYYYLSPGTHVRKIQQDIQDKMNYSYPFNELIAAIELTNPKGFNQFIGELLQDCPHERIVLDSLINKHHVDEVFAGFERVSMLGINAPFAERVKRVSRRPSFAGLSIEEVEGIVSRVDQYEMSLGLGDLLLWCDAWIFTGGQSQEEFQKQVASFADDFRIASLVKKLEMLGSSFPSPTEWVIENEPFKKYKEWMS